ncbi:MAG: capsid assembly scaffolding protein Gp46 family protein [Actinomycetota bacterium]
MSENGDTQQTSAPPAEKTFTQDEVNRIVEDRLKRERAKFSDYDELRRRAEEADKSKSDIEKLTETVSQLKSDLGEERQRSLRAEVAQAKGLTPRQARRLTGSTKEELEADADEILEDFGVKRDGGGNGGGSGETGQSGDGGETGETESGKSDEGSEAGGDSRSIGTPREKLRSGGSVPKAEPEEMDPRKLAEAIPRDL